MTVQLQKMKMLVGGDWKDSANGARSSIRDPSTGEIIAEVPKASKQDAKELRRSEEHTSELQSRPHLVCRLLLEKKKTPGPLRLSPPHALRRARRQCARARRVAGH